MLSAGFLYYSVKDVAWGEVVSAVAGARPGWVLALAGASVAALYIRALRWRVLLRFHGHVPLYPAVSATFIGFGANAILPFRIGEIVRPALLGLRLRIGMSAPLSSIVVERLVDVLFVIGCSLVVGLLYPVPEAARVFAAIGGTFAVTVVVLLLLILRYQAPAERLMKRLLARFPHGVEVRARPVFRGLVNGLSGLSGARTMGTVLLYSVYLWTIIAFTFACGILALNLPVRDGVLAAALASVVIVALMMLLPTAPGGLGAWQWGCAAALVIFGVDKSGAAAFGWLTWLVNMVVTVGGLFIFMARDGLSFGQLFRMAERNAPAS